MIQDRFFKTAAPVLLTAAMLLGMSSAAFAATKDKIGAISIDIQYELTRGMGKSDIEVELLSI